jgi:hypothetical protein
MDGTTRDCVETGAAMLHAYDERDTLTSFYR